jgi:hypothetical protein
MGVCRTGAPGPAIRIAAVLQLRIVAVQAFADLRLHDVAHRCIRSVLSEQPHNGEATLTVTPPAADFEHRCAPCSHLAKQDQILRHAGLYPARNTIRRTGRLETPSIPVSNSTFPALPPQPS